MLIQYNPEAYTTETRTTVCSFHQEHPGQNYAGCCCSGTFSLRLKTVEELQASEEKPEPLFGTNIRQAIDLIRRWRKGR